MFFSPFISFIQQPKGSGFMAIASAFSNTSTKAVAESLSWITLFLNSNNLISAGTGWSDYH